MKRIIKSGFKLTPDLNRTLRDLEKSLEAWDNVRVTETPRPPKETAASMRESELSLRTHLLFQMLKEQLDELSSKKKTATL